ncbi:hypothetical protein MRS44_014752 [Fusarium solani]|uniref:uncharacterized protein n=1 Tax=Fusarium solani TaxID=169388 RepID=UPI0032C4735A|nr:hypothetical protein MRS44_014752 [Fusarium solani]
MASPADVVMGDAGESSTQKPFTVEENIKQLNAIDQSAVQLMSHTATALNALTTPSSGDGAPNTDPSGEAMKRQIFALEEAGIVNLANPQRQEPNGPPKASLKPNGTGAVGNLDVGWLNSRGTRVERDMESELWARAKEVLQKEAAKDN